ncbi:MAG: tol-pal system protein YbgF [Gammaproteobacteria bacterium]|nr:tol-pal system protein YbgF [Gammaproteobacteria bacterium]
MRKYASQLKALFLFSLVYILTASTAFSQVQVVEAGAVNADNTNASTGTPQANQNSGNGNEIVVTLYNMVEALQREVQILRGLVEEQSYQIRLMENEQRDRYLDVDNRLSELNQRIPLGVNGLVISNSGSIIEPSALELEAQTALNPTIDNSVINLAIDEDFFPGTVNNNTQTPALLNEVVNLEPKSEEELYQDARNLLLNDGEFEASISIFQQLIEDYPQGRLAPNAYYWQGEALILIDRYSQAINVFNQVVNNFPTHEKAPDSMLKLGIVYSLMENEPRAQQVWRELLEDFADSGSASLRLAEVYLREGYNR